MTPVTYTSLVADDLEVAEPLPPTRMRLPTDGAAQRARYIAEGILVPAGSARDHWADCPCLTLDDETRERLERRFPR